MEPRNLDIEHIHSFKLLLDLARLLVGRSCDGSQRAIEPNRARCGYVTIQNWTSRGAKYPGTSFYLPYTNHTKVIITESFYSVLNLGNQEPKTSREALNADGAQNIQLSPRKLVMPATLLTITFFH